MNKISNTIIIVLISIAICSSSASAQIMDITSVFSTPIQSGITYPTNFASDARGTAMGYVGAATTPDANSQYWNPSKYAFANSYGAIGVNCSPYFKKHYEGIFNSYLSGYWKLGYNDNQALSASLRYFSLGEVNTSDASGVTIQSLNPYEMSFDLGYSRKLSENFSMGVAFRYIYSDLGFFNSYAGDQISSASAFAADISGYYSTYPANKLNICQWAWGWNLSNFGTKVGYNNGEDPAFLPTNLRIGTTFSLNFSENHNLAFSFDINKFLTPDKPHQSDFDMDTPEGLQAYLDALEDWENMSSFSGIANSIFDEKISFSLGAEYNYNKFYVRSGYFHKYGYGKPFRQVGIGIGYSFDIVQIDASCLLAIKRKPIFEQPLYLSLSFDIKEIAKLIH
ncbi:MAG: type IX secretion system outer membrane channel protein PorV [Muribaculaceae bacterium]|nr:type IX secretion system outer membrane channel protein PorV [Muribaculaceae bacterium]